MITGQPAFGGEDVTVVLARVLERAADLSALPQSVSVAVQHTIKLCLQKDPKKRIADIRDVRLALEGAFETSARASRARLAWTVATVAMLVAVALAIPAVRYLREAPALQSAASSVRMELVIPPGVELFTATNRNVSISPDGSQVAYIGVDGATRAVYLRRIDGFDTVRLRGTETASGCCAFSPDGRFLTFDEVDGSVKKVSLADGLITSVGESGGSSFGGDAWGSDGSIVFSRSQSLWRVPSSGGEATQVITRDAAGRVGFPTVLPGGGAILFASTELGSDQWRIESVELATGERSTVLERGTLPLYAPTGHLIFFRDEELLAAPFDVETRQVTGTATRMLENLPAGPSGAPFVDVAAAGTLVYAPVTSAARLVWVTRDGREQPVNDTPRMYQNPRVDPKGRWVLVQAGSDLWVQDLTRSTFTHVVSGLAPDAFSILTLDGERVVYKTDTSLSWTALDGSGRSESIPKTTGDDFPGSVSTDGEQLLFVRMSVNTSGDVYQVALSGDADVKPVLATQAYDGSAKLSPDGRWLLYTSDDSGQMQVYLRPFPAPDQRWQVSTQGGTQPLWNPNGGEIFYRDGSRMMSVRVLTADGRPVLADPELLFEGPYAFGRGLTIANYDVSADGERFLLVKEDARGAHLKVIMNWTQELERVAPTP
jgi:serine/threonine-protein kinase